MISRGVFSVVPSNTPRHWRQRQLSLLASGALVIATFAVLGAPAAMCAAPPRSAPVVTPEVIAPEAIPALQAVWSGSATKPVAASAFSSAPMPDADAALPVVVSDDNPALQPAFYSHKKQFRGDGFGPGSTAQDVQDRAAKPTAGLALNVPLD